MPFLQETILDVLLSFAFSFFFSFAFSSNTTGVLDESSELNVNRRLSETSEICYLLSALITGTKYDPYQNLCSLHIKHFT